MGVRGLQSFLNAEVPNGYKRINMLEEIENFQE